MRKLGKLGKLGELNDRFGIWLLLFIGLVVIPGLNQLQVGEGAARQSVINIVTVNQLGRYLSFAIVALGVDLIWGYAGILSLCQAMFFCFGGYAIGMYIALHGPLDGDVVDAATGQVIKEVPRCLWIVTSEVKGFRLPWFWQPFQTLPAALLLVMLIPGVTAYIFGYLAFRSRVKGVYFSIITQATTLAVCLIFRRNSMRLCGTNGMNFFEGTAVLGYDIRSAEFKLLMYILTVLALFGVYLLCRWLVASRFGRVLVAIRDNESRLRFSGYQPLYFKLAAFTLAAVIAGIGGMLYTPQTGIITPYNMEPERSILMVIWVAVGGRGTLSGAVVGALAVNYAYSILTTAAPASWPFVQGAAFIAVVLFFRVGLVGAWRRLTGLDEESAAKAPPLAEAKA